MISTASSRPITSRRTFVQRIFSELGADQVRGVAHVLEDGYGNRTS